MQEGHDVDSNRQRGEADGERGAGEGRGGLGAPAFAHGRLLVATRALLRGTVTVAAWRVATRLCNLALDETVA